jgi:hypothetical protein
MLAIELNWQAKLKKSRLADKNTFDNFFVNPVIIFIVFQKYELRATSYEL